MKELTFLLIGLVLGVSLLNPVSVQAATTTYNEVAYRAVLFELIEVLQKQILLLQAELINQNQNNIVANAIENSYQNSIPALVTYNIAGEESLDDISNRKQQDYLQKVFDLFPSDYDEKIGRFMVFDGNDLQIDAFVETIPPLHDKWVFAVSADILSDTTSEESTELIVHELGHLVSYESIVGLPAPAISSCVDYFNTHGCPVENSYLKQFVNQFWSSSDLARVEDTNQSDDAIKETDKYYKSHKSEFVSDYAASAPEEDLAESFMYFIFSKPVKGELAKRKVNFFYKYPDLVEMKTDIQSVIENN